MNQLLTACFILFSFTLGFKLWGHPQDLMWVDKGMITLMLVGYSVRFIIEDFMRGAK
jgi:hypothetical protein